MKKKFKNISILLFAFALLLHFSNTAHAEDAVRVIKMNTWATVDTDDYKNSLEIHPGKTGIAELSFRNVSYRGGAGQLKVSVTEYMPTSDALYPTYDINNIFVDNLPLNGTSATFPIEFYEKAHYAIHFYIHDNDGYGDANFDIKVSFLPKSKATALKVPNKVTISTGVKNKLNVTAKSILTENAPSTLKWKTSNKKIATINSKGEILGKKKGKCTVSCTYNKKKYKCTVYVKDNIYVNRKKYSVYDFDYANPALRITKAYYNKKTLVVKCKVYNNRMFKLTSIDKIKVQVYSESKTDSLNYYKMASRTFRKLKVNAKPYSAKEITLKFPVKSIQELRTRDIWISYGSFIYHYVY